MKLNKNIISYILLLIVFIIPYFMFEKVKAPSVHYYPESAFEQMNMFYAIMMFIYFFLLTSILISIKYVKDLLKNRGLLFAIYIPVTIIIIYFTYALFKISFLEGYKDIQYEIMRSQYCEIGNPCGAPPDYRQASLNLSDWIFLILIAYYFILGLIVIYYKKIKKDTRDVIKTVCIKYIIIFLIAYIFFNIIIRTILLNP